jgi:Aldehyde dehydrogenase family
VTGHLLLAKIFEEAALPKGVLNVVIGPIAEIGDEFTLHPIPKRELGGPAPSPARISVSSSLHDGYDEPDGVFGRPELNTGKEALRSRLMVERGLFWAATNVRRRIAAWNILPV